MFPGLWTMSQRSLENPVEAPKLRYLSYHYHSVRERIADGSFDVHWVAAHDQLADGLTKAIAAPHMADVRKQLGLH